MTDITTDVLNFAPFPDTITSCFYFSGTGNGNEKHSNNKNEIATGKTEEGEREQLKLQIVEGGLNYILKNFGDLGFFHGLIISYDEPYYQVIYEDGDSEELGLEEVESYLFPVTSIPQETVITLEKLAKTMITSTVVPATISIDSTSRVSRNKEIKPKPRGNKLKRVRRKKEWEVDDDDDDDVDNDTDGYDDKGSDRDEKNNIHILLRDLAKNHDTVADDYPCISESTIRKLKTFVLKPFGDMGEFYGLIIGLDESFYKVIYEDGDSEELTWDEVQTFLTPSSSVQTETVNLLRTLAKSMTASASPSDFSNDKSKRKHGSGYGKGSSRMTSSSKKRKRIQVISDDDDNDNEEEEEEKIDDFCRDMTINGRETFVLKSFGELGDFYGLIVSFNDSFYKVIYEDGDCEEFTYEEVQTYAVSTEDVGSKTVNLLRKQAKSMTALASPSDFSEDKAKKKKRGDRAVNESSDKTTRFKQEEDDNLSDKWTEKNNLLLSNSMLALREPVDTFDNYVLYSDGDSEELTRDEVDASLTSADSISNEIKNILRSHAREYKKNPVPYHRDVENTDFAAPNISKYKEVPTNSLYNEYVNRLFVDTEENKTYRVKSVCLHTDYDILLFQYFDELLFVKNPKLFEDPDNYEYSACSEMLKVDSWCKWAPVE